MKKIALGIYVILITGCIPSPIWIKPGGSQEEFGRVKYKCLQESQQTQSDTRVNGYQAASSTGAVTNHLLFESCMNAQGWFFEYPKNAPTTTTAEEPPRKKPAKTAKKRVEEKPEPTVAAQSSQSPSTTPSSNMIAKQNKTNVRKSPSSKATVIKTLKKGEEVQVIKQKDEWLFVKLSGGETGWCHNSVLSQKN